MDTHRGLALQLLYPLDHDSARCRARHLKDVIVGLQKKDRNLESKWINLHICCLVIKFVRFEGNNIMDHRPEKKPK
jgi:hypothetical protein